MMTNLEHHASRRKTRFELNDVRAEARSVARLHHGQLSSRNTTDFSMATGEERTAKVATEKGEI